MKRIILFLMLALILLSACEIKEPALPVWDLDLNIPLINERYYVSDLADSVNLIVDENDLMYMLTEGELDTPEVGEINIYPNLELFDAPVLSGIEFSQTSPFMADEQGLHLRYGLVESGSISARFAGVDPATEILSLSILEIHQPSGEALVIEYAGSEEWIHIDLAGYYFGALESAQDLSELTLEVTATSSHPDFTPIAEMSLVMLEPVSFSVFQGDFENYEILAGESVASIEIEYPHGIDEAVQVSEAFLEIEIVNELGFECEFIGFMRGIRGDLTRMVPILDDDGEHFRIEAGSADEPGYSNLLIHDGLQILMQMMPETIEIIDARFIIDSQSGSGMMRKEDTIRADYTVRVPFRLTVFEYPITIQDATEIEVDEDNRDLIDKNLMGAGLIMQAQNMIPLGGTAYAYFGTSSDIDVDDPQSFSFVKSLTLHSSQTSSDWQEPVSLELSKTELNLFTLPRVYLKWSFVLEPSDGEVEIYAGPDDFIGLKSMLHAKIRVEDI